MVNHKIHTNLLQFESLNFYDSLLHFSTTIDGGVSKGSYTSFNLGIHSGDDVENVNENRNRLISMLNISSDNLIFPYQTHGDSVCVIDSEFISKNIEERLLSLNGIDALITNLKGVCIGVATADCVPILIFDPINKVLATVHAGWRGTVSKLTQKVISIMVDRFGSNPSNLIAGIGPSICSENFEVGAEVVDAFVEAGFLVDDIGFYNFETNKFHVDLWETNKLLLVELGLLLSNIEVASLCTYANADKFFSARRQTIKSGRMITGGVLID